LNKISGQQNLPAPPLHISIPAAGTFMLPAGQGIVGGFGSVLSPQLASGNVLTGQYMIQMGLYTSLQVYDYALQYWCDVQVSPFQLLTISSDGTNYRIANTTGCPVGAIITNAGSGLTNGFNTVAVTPSAGGSVWNTLVGGAINTTVTITAGGTNYKAAPILLFTPPANQGTTPYILPAATCTISAGVINAVTVTQVGAGLVAAPIITVIPVPGDTTGGGGVLTVNATLAQSGTLLAMWPAANTLASATSNPFLPVQQAAPYGTALTAVPTFTFNPASTIAATAIMNFTITSITNTTPGVTYVTAGAAFSGGIVAGAAANANAVFDKALSLPIFPPINVAATTGVTTLAGPFGGVNIQAVPLLSVFSSASTVATAAVQTPVVGGATDTLLFMPI
jgi:hypothetical protein